MSVLTPTVVTWYQNELHINIEGKGGVIAKLNVGELKTLTDDDRHEKLKALLTKEGVRVPGMILESALEYHSVFFWKTWRKEQ